MAGIEWVSSRDMAFFFLEGPTTPYHIAALMIVEGPVPSHKRLLRVIEGRLPLVPRFRQRLEYVPFLNRPAWIDDPSFDLEYHVRRTRVPAPGTEEQLKHVIAELMEEHVNRFRPLWELWAVDGLRGGRFALLLKTHHAMVDGATGAYDLSLLFDRRPDPYRGIPEPWRARPTGGHGRLAVEAAADLAALPFGAVRALGRAALHPVALAGTVLTGAAGAAELAKAALSPAPRTPFNTLIGPNRAFDFVRVPFDDVCTIKADLGGTVNDVILAATAGGLRRWFLARGERVDGTTLRALVPVSVRPRGSSATAGNRVTGVLAPLPVFEPDPTRRLDFVARHMRAAKGSRQAIGAGMLLELPGLVPPSVARRVAGIQRVQRFLNLSLTNVRGPESPLYLSGRRVLEIVPVLPLSANAALIVGAMSYAGSLTFGLVVDPGVVPDVHVLAEGIEKSVQELLHAAGGRSC
jgi:WS/DGAT/MGAT family acyltransferase